MNASIDAVLHSAVESGRVPNVVGVVADDSGVIYEGAAGPLAAGQARPVDANSVFRIASMTKLVCTVAALQQRERGNLDFDAPVDRYCPAFAAVHVLDGFDLAGQPRVRPPASRATVRQLVTHTTGLAYGFWNSDILRWDEIAKPDNIFSLPMAADPGTTFAYGVSTDWLGKVVETASGQPLDEYLAENILAPLGMDSTSFAPTAEQRARCVPVHAQDESGQWVATNFDWDEGPDWWSGGHGLYSTPRDYLLFQQMLLGDGKLAGATILDRPSVREMFTNQIGDLWFPAMISTADPGTSCDFVAGRGMRWGWGLMLNSGQLPGRRAAGSGGWGGLFNTYFWLDPSTRIAGALYSHFLPFADPDVMQTYADFERAIYATFGGAK